MCCKSGYVGLKLEQFENQVGDVMKQNVKIKQEESFLQHLKDCEEDNSERNM